jgi:hypothetical protein
LFLRNVVSRKRSSPPTLSTKKKFLTGVVLLLVMLGLAARPLARGAMFYQSYWGGAVFVPFVLFIAAALVVMVVITWKRK